MANCKGISRALCAAWLCLSAGLLVSCAGCGGSEPVPVAEFSLSEDEVMKAEGAPRLVFKPRDAAREVTVTLTMSDAYGFDKIDSANLPKSGVRVLKAGQPVTATSQEPTLFSYASPYKYIDPTVLEVKFVPTDIEEFEIKVDPIKGFKQYKIAVVQ